MSTLKRFFTPHHSPSSISAAKNRTRMASKAKSSASPQCAVSTPSPLFQSTRLPNSRYLSYPPNSWLLELQSGVTGFVRSYGAHLPAEGITLNAICPNVVKTGISTSDFYETLEAQNLLTPMESLLGVFESLLGEDKRSGEIFEVGPKGVQTRDAPEPMDRDTATVLKLIQERGRPLHLPVP
jgi:hypothetical protein